MHGVNRQTGRKITHIIYAVTFRVEEDSFGVDDHDEVRCTCCKGTGTLTVWGYIDDRGYECPERYLGLATQIPERGQWRTCEMDEPRD
jgi:hypothetical protein